MLDAGQEEQAKAELSRALAFDPVNKMAANLMRQIEVDPLATLGRESFQYKVQPGESLSKIAGAYLGDPMQFYILARYNDIKVPRLLAGGQMIRVPGKPRPPARPEVSVNPPAGGPAQPSSSVPAPAPAASAAPAPVPPPPPPLSPAEVAMKEGAVAEGAGKFEAAYTAYQRAAGLFHPGAMPKVEQIRKRLITDYTRAAIQATSRQDLKGAVVQWDNVLRLDPTNETARSERRRALEGIDLLNQKK